MRRIRPEEQRRPQGRRGVWHLKLMTLSVVSLEQVATDLP